MDHNFVNNLYFFVFSAKILTFGNMPQNKRTPQQQALYDRQTVAFANSMGLSCEGAAAILENPTTAAAFSNIATSFDCMIDDKLADKKFNEVYEKSLPETDDHYWASYSDFDFDYDDKD